VFVPEWPADKMQYATAFLQLGCFDLPRISGEDLERTRMYAEERQRSELKTKVGSLDEWLMSLGTRVRFVRLDASNLPRTAQLMNKTNQMNLRTRRLGEPELLLWANEPGHELWAVYVSDKLGDAGLTGILGLEVKDGALEIVDYILSCRVMGRRVEETLAWYAVERARRQKLGVVRVPFFPTAKNKPTRTFWDGSGFAHVAEGDTYVWDRTEPFPKPESVTVEEVAS
jgi:FkbH-like protein